MKFGISGLSIIPVRREPVEKSEMVSQVLFGECFEIMEELVGWCNIRLAYDGYEGWVDKKMITPLTQASYRRMVSHPAAVTADVLTMAPQNERSIMLVAGSSLPCWRPYKRQFSIGRDIFDLRGRCLFGKIASLRETLVRQALMYFNAPYLWGGRSPFGIDCSGFAQIIYKMIGIRLPRDAAQQVLHGLSLTFVEEARPGDLAFFDNADGDIVHVGIIWEKGKIIHASGKVRIDDIDHNGIYNSDTHKYTHQLRVIKKILDD
jgi:hypothetical protein